MVGASAGALGLPRFGELSQAETLDQLRLDCRGLSVDGVGAERLAYDHARGARTIGLFYDPGDGFGHVVWVS